MIRPLEQVEVHSSFPGALLRSAFEVAGRIVDPDHAGEPVERVSCGQLREADVAPVLAQVRADAQELRSALLG